MVGTSPEVRARIDTMVAVPIDVGCEWLRSDGTLPIREVDALVANGTRRGVPIAVDTTTRTEDGAVGGPRTPPRMLYVAGSAGTRVDLVITGINATILSVTACEYWEREVP